MVPKSQVAIIALISFLLGAGGAYWFASGQPNRGPVNLQGSEVAAVSNGSADKPEGEMGTQGPIATVTKSGQNKSWSQYRGDNGQGDATDADIPVKWSNKENIHWKTRLVGRGASSPIIVGDNVFLTAYTGFCMALGDKKKKDDLRLHVICLDRLSGKQKWTRSIKANPASQNPNKEFITHGFASSTPVCDGERVYAFFGVSGVFAFDVEGNYLWQADLGSEHDHFGSSASPILYDNLLIVNASLESKRLIALDKVTGSIVWIFDNVIRTWASPSIGKSKDGRDELVMNQSFIINGIDPLTGEKLWSVDGIKDYVVPIPVINGDIAYVSGGKQSRIMAIKLGGAGDVTETNKLWDSPLVANVPSPVLHENSLCVVGENRILQQFDISNGKQMAKARVGGQQNVFAPLVKTRDYFYLATPGVGISVVERKAKFKVVATNKPDREDAVSMTACSMSGNDLFYRTDDWIYCVGKTDKPVSQQKVTLDEAAELLVSKPKPNLNPGNNKPKLYVRYMSGTKEETSALVLRPYDNVITEGEERESLVALVGSHWDEYLAVRADEKALLMQQNQIPDEDYVAGFSDIEKRMMALDGKVRGKVRSSFSEEQMAQHKADHAAYIKSLDEKTRAQHKKGK
jgi:outer membrane protein assembly factor BamB